MNIKRLINFLKLPYYFVNIKKYEHSTVGELVEFIFSGAVDLIKPMQIPEEIEGLLNVLDQENLETVLEIGTAKGGTLFTFTKISADNSTLISIDLPHGKFGGGYSSMKVPIFKSFASDDQEIHLIRSDSHNNQTLEKVKNLLNGKRIDFLFIDGDHRYEGVKQDFDIYSPYVRDGGYVAFHDIVDGPADNVGGVPRFWNEIKGNYEYKQFIQDSSQMGCGIGLIKKRF